MGQVTYFTKEQKIILQEFKEDDVLRSLFYLTGGTALSAVYLNHRLSDDLDFFSENQYDRQLVVDRITAWGEKLKLEISSTSNERVQIFNLIFPGGEPLKVDFAYYPHKRIGEATVIDLVEIDSLNDIAANKLMTINQRTEVKDYVDLFFLLKQFTVWDLIEGVRLKFKIKLEPFVVGSDFLKIESFEFLPKMIKSLTLAELKAFFTEKAKKLASAATT